VSVQSAVKAISAAVRRAGISKLFGAAGDINVQGKNYKMILIPPKSCPNGYLLSSFNTQERLLRSWTCCRTSFSSICSNLRTRPACSSLRRTRLPLRSKRREKVFIKWIMNNHICRLKKMMYKETVQ